MGTFHQDKGDLHGITVVVDTLDGEVFVGRCDTVMPEGVVLLQGASHAEGRPGADGQVVSSETFLDRAARFGVWPAFERFVVPADRVRDIRRLGDVAQKRGP